MREINYISTIFKYKKYNCTKKKIEIIATAGGIYIKSELYATKQWIKATWKYIRHLENNTDICAAQMFH